MKIGKNFLIWIILGLAADIIAQTSEYVYDTIKPEFQEPGFSPEIKAGPAGLYSIADMGALFGPGELDPASINITLAYQFIENYSLGAGTGIEFFNETVLPLFGEIRYTFNGKLVAPTAFLQTGYSFPLVQPENDYYYYWNEDSEAKGGIMVNPGMGIVFNLNRGTSFLFAMGFRYQELEYQRHNDWTDETVYRTDFFKRLNMRVGLYFK